jgi:hypothetical protein
MVTDMGREMVMDMEMWKRRKRKRRELGVEKMSL